MGNNVGVEHRENIFASTAYCLWCARRELAFTAISITYPSEPEKKVPIRPKVAFRDSSRAFAPVIASYELYARLRWRRRTRHHLGRKTFKQTSCLVSGLAVARPKGRMLPGFWRERIPTDQLIKRRMISEQNQCLFRQTCPQTCIEPAFGFPLVGMAR